MNGYCPICNKDITILEWEDNYCSCPVCGHHINLKGEPAMKSFKLNKIEFVEVRQTREYEFTEKDVENFKKERLSEYWMQHIVDKEEYTTIINAVTLEAFMEAIDGEMEDVPTWETQYGEDNKYKYTDYLDTIITDYCNEIMWDQEVIDTEYLNTFDEMHEINEVK